MDTRRMGSHASSLITIDPGSSVAPYEQIRVRLLTAVTAAELPAEHRLPPVRTLAAELGVAPGTVARAYKELEAAGIIETRGRAGTFVSAQGDPVARRIQAAAAVFAGEARSLGIGPDAALEYARRALED